MVDTSGLLLWKVRAGQWRLSALFHTLKEQNPKPVCSNADLFRSCDLLWSCEEGAPPPRGIKRSRLIKKARSVPVTTT